MIADLGARALIAELVARCQKREAAAPGANMYTALGGVIPRRYDGVSMTELGDECRAILLLDPRAVSRPGDVLLAASGAPC